MAVCKAQGFQDELMHLVKAKASGLDMARRHAMRMDELIRKCLPEDFSRSPFAIFALGGYGRQELSPYSDVDILFFSRKRKDTSYIEDVYYTILNAGIPISQSFRTPQECIDEAGKDLTTRTALLDSRFIAGNPEVADLFTNRVMPELSSLLKRNKAFYLDIVREVKERHRKYGESVYLLEPDVKQSAGGLRDLHDALWVARITLGLTCYDDFRKIMENRDFRRLMKAYDYLLRVRCALHLVCGRGNNVLSFEHQKDTAELLGITASHRFTPSERLLRLYYLRATTLRQMTDKIRNMAGSFYTTLTRNFQRYRINETFSQSGNRIMIDHPGYLTSEPWRIIEAYLLAARTGKGLTTYLRDHLARSRRLLGRNGPGATRISTLFMEILRSHRVYDTLRLMHEDRVLDRLIPEFGALRYLVVHEPHHKYTVDEHSLLAIKALEDLKYAKGAVETRLLHLFNALPQREVPYLALLLHDIGKSMGRNHSVEGYKFLLPITERLKIGPRRRHIIEFLVRNHLLMSRTSFTQDVEDPQTITRFTETVRDEEHLNALFLVTYADMSAVSPDFWTSWRKQLLLDLYNGALGCLRGIGQEPGKYVEALIQGSQQRQEMASFLKCLPGRYLLSSTPELAHAEFALMDEVRAEGFGLALKCSANGTCALSLAARDRPGLLSAMVSVLSARRLNIVSVRTFEHTEDIVIDRIVVSNYEEIWWEGLFDLLRQELKEVVLGKAPPVLQHYGRKKERFTPFLYVDNESSLSCTIFETMAADRMGLLSDITGVFARHGLNISFALVNTETDVAQDVFHVSHETGKGGKTGPVPAPLIHQTMAELWDVIK